MEPANDQRLGPNDDRIFEIYLRGDAQSLYEAEDRYLDMVLPEILELIGSPLTNAELAEHPIMKMLFEHGSRPREDSIL